MIQEETLTTPETTEWTSTRVMMTDRGRGEGADHMRDKTNTVKEETMMTGRERGAPAPQVIAVMTIIRRRRKENSTRKRSMQTQSLVLAKA